MSTEKTIQNEIMLAVGASPRGRVWRNNTGMLPDRFGAMVRYGLCVGSSDLIGIWDGRFLAVEVKKPGKKASKEQEAFLGIVRKFGGIAFVAHSAAEAMAQLEGEP